VSRVFLKYYLKSTLSSKYLWGWSIAFMLFWLVLGAVELKAGAVPRAPLEGLLAYTGSWYSTVVVIGLGSAAVGLSHEFVFSSISARYLAKYSRLTSSKLYGSLLLGFTAICVVVSSVLLAATYLLYSWVAGESLAPANVAGATATTIATGVMLYAFAATAVYSAIALRRARAVYFVAYLPLILALGLGITQVYVDLGRFIVISPFNAAETLLFSYYSGLQPRLSSLVSFSGPEVPLWLLWLSLTAWITGLSILAVVLLRLQRGVGVEEMRLL